MVSLEQLIAAGRRRQYHPGRNVNLGLDYAMAHAEIAELLDACLPRC
jgi:hypothetical protein